MNAVSAPEKLKKWRADEKLTLAVAAEKAGVQASAWFDWESGNKTPTVDRAEDIERVTGGAVTVGDWATHNRAKRAEKDADKGAA